MITVRGHRIRIAVLVLALIFFALPFFTVTCSGIGVSVSGLNMAFGTSIADPTGMGAGQQIAVQGSVLVAFLFGLIALGLAVVALAKGHLRRVLAPASGVAALVSFISLLVFWGDFSSQLGGYGSAVAHLDYGYWLSLLLFLAGVALSGWLAYKEVVATRASPRFQSATGSQASTGPPGAGTGLGVAPWSGSTTRWSASEAVESTVARAPGSVGPSAAAAAPRVEVGVDDTAVRAPHLPSRASTWAPSTLTEPAAVLESARTNTPTAVGVETAAVAIPLAAVPTADPSVVPAPVTVEPVGLGSETAEGVAAELVPASVDGSWAGHPAVVCDVTQATSPVDDAAFAAELLTTEAAKVVPTAAARGSVVDAGTATSAPAQAQPTPRSLARLEGPGRPGEAWILPQGREIHIGRENSCFVALVDGKASRQHALLSYRADGLYVTDLGSSNGTRVNGEHLGAEPKRLTVGDKVRVGDTVLEVCV